MGFAVEISVSTRHGELSSDVQETIKQKAIKLPRFFDRTTGIEVLVDLENTQNPKVEVKVSAEATNDFFAADTGPNVIAAVDSVIQKLEKQLRKHKEKITDHRGKSNKNIDVEIE
jgi:putative sigma-54 modulation protein